MSVDPTLYARYLSALADPDALFADGGRDPFEGFTFAELSVCMDEAEQSGGPSVPSMSDMPLDPKMAAVLDDPEAFYRAASGLVTSVGQPTKWMVEVIRRAHL